MILPEETVIKSFSSSRYLNVISLGKSTNKFLANSWSCEYDNPKFSTVIRLISLLYVNLMTTIAYRKFLKSRFYSKKGKEALSNFWSSNE